MDRELNPARRSSLRHRGQRRRLQPDRGAVCARVVAVEPGYPTFAALSENVVRNGAQDRVTALPVALGRSTALETLHLRTLDVGAALHTLGDHVGPSEAVYHQPVLNFRLDDLLERFGLPRPAHIKLDADGTKLDVLAGADRTLSDPTLRTVLTELDEEKGERLEGVLAEHGLHCVTASAARRTRAPRALRRRNRPPTGCSRAPAERSCPSAPRNTGSEHDGPGE